jgi:hypothetical protein
MSYHRIALLLLMLLPLPAASAQALLPRDWSPRQAADRVLAGLIPVTAPHVKGAHDAEMAIVNDRAFIVAEVNDERPGEGAGWPCVYAAMSLVNLKTMAVERIIPVARSEQAFANETLPVGACFVPRLLQKDDRTLRCYFASEQPGVRQSQTWFIDFDLGRMAFENTIRRAKLKTAAGTFDMQPRYFHADAAARGFRRPPKDYGLYLFDSFKVFDGKTCVAINNWPGGQLALAVVNAARDTFEVIGHYNEPQNLLLSESAVNRLPDGTWMAICRQDGGNRNYTITTSPDGRTWAPGAHRDVVPNGTNSKPTFDCFKGVYYLGWQEATRINGVHRSVFNVDVSADGAAWERKYRFETEKSFQYPTFRDYNGSIYLTVTQGNHSESRKERIMFGRLELLTVAEQVARRQVGGIAAYKPPNSHPENERRVYDFVGMIGLPLVPCHEFPTDAKAAFLSIHAWKDPKLVEQFSAFNAGVLTDRLTSGGLLVGMGSPVPLCTGATP